MSSSPPVHSRDALYRLGRLVRKELLEVIRDRRTIITLVLMPLLLYPLLSVAFQQFFRASTLEADTAPSYVLGFRNQEELHLFARYVNYQGRAADPVPPPPGPEVKMPFQVLD